jgi:hypothetical protein
MKFDLLFVQNRSRTILEDWLLACSLGAIVVGWHSQRSRRPSLGMLSLKGAGLRIRHLHVLHFVEITLTQVWLHGVIFPSQINGLTNTMNTLLERVSAMDIANEALFLIGHEINLDKVLMRITRLAPDSMLASVRTHQQTTQTSDALFGTTNHSAECNWHYNRALHRFFICVTTFGATPTNRTPQCNWHCNRALHRFFICVTTFGATPTNRTPQGN